MENEKTNNKINSPQTEGEQFRVGGNPNRSHLNSQRAIERFEEERKYMEQRARHLNETAQVRRSVSQPPVHAAPPQNAHSNAQHANSASHAPARSVKRRKKRGNGGKIAIIIILIVAIAAVGGAGFFALKALPAPDAKITNTASGVKLSWDEVEGAENYEIYKETADGKKLVKTTSDKSYTDKSAKNGETVSYRVRAVSEKSKGRYAKLSIFRLASVTISDTAVTPNDITIIWDALDTATEYQIYKIHGDEDAVKLASVGSSILSYTDSEIEKNSVYSYIVTQQTAHGEGPKAKATGVATMATILDSASVKNSPKGVTVTWKGDNTFAEGFNVYCKVDGGKWTLAGTAGRDAKSFIDKNAPYGKTASYRVTIKLSETAEGDPKGAGKVYAVDPGKKLVALTYDDGPYSPVTNVILDTMEKYNAHCTFFVVGNRVETYNACVTRATELGCEVGSHTYDHKYLTKISADEAQYQLDEAKKVIAKYAGKCTIMRPPGGYILSGIEYPEIMWSVDTLDWSNRNAETTLANAKKGIFDGCIVLMHDLYRSSSAATEQLVPYLIENNYQLVTVSELMDARGITMENGKAYYSAKK